MNPVEIAVPVLSTVRSRAGLYVRRCDIQHGDVRIIRRLRATTVHRTLRDLSLTRPAVEALIAIDMALRLSLTDRAALFSYSDSARGRPGVRRLRSLVDLAEPAESPMETRLRWLLREAGLPRPEVQTNLYTTGGRFIGRADLYYPWARLVVEYDGGIHRDQLAGDDRRQNLLVDAGFRVLRFTAADIYQHPEVVAAQVRGSLGLQAPVWRQTGMTRAERGRVWRQTGGIGPVAVQALGQQPTL